MFLLRKGTNSTVWKEQQRTQLVRNYVLGYNAQMDLSVLIYCLLNRCVSSNALASHTAAIRNTDVGTYKQTWATQLQSPGPSQKCSSWFGLLDSELLFFLPCTSFLTLLRFGVECLEIGVSDPVLLFLHGKNWYENRTCIFLIKNYFHTADGS